MSPVLLPEAPVAAAACALAVELVRRLDVCELELELDELSSSPGARFVTLDAGSLTNELRCQP
jgi:hypothetical protein